MGRYIALALPAFLALLLFAPVKAEFTWRKESLSLRLRLLWLFPLTILPAKPGGKEKKPKKPKKPKKEAPGEGAEAPPPPKKRDPAERALELLRTVNDLLPHLASFIGYILKRLTLSRCRIALVIAGEEADQVGIGVGRAYAVGYGVYSGLCGVIRVREFRYNVLPDYISGEGAADAEFTLELRPSTLLAGALILLVRGAATLLRGQRPAATTKVRR